MVGRRYIPLILLGVLIVLTGLFAGLAVHTAPPSGDIAAENAAAATFDSPLGSHSLTLDLTNTVSAGGHSGVLRLVRRITYVPPARMVVYETHPRLERLGTVRGDRIIGSLSGYAGYVGGSATWVHQGSALTRTESLSTFTRRVSHTAAPRGNVYESIDVRDGYLVYLRIKVVLPSQRLSSGQSATGGVIGETLQIVSINGHAAPALSS
jgi:hypothetical protein